MFVSPRTVIVKIHWSSSEFIKGLIAGVAATLIGFGLTMCWDNYKFRRDIQEREAVVLAVLQQEVTTNLELATRNQKALTEELDLLRQDRTLVQPLAVLHVGAWDLVRVNIPRKIASNQRQLVKIARMAQAAEDANESIRSRETYRTFNGASSNFLSVMRAYDEHLQKETASLLALIADVQTELAQR